MKSIMAYYFFNAVMVGRWGGVYAVHGMMFHRIMNNFWNIRMIYWLRTMNKTPKYFFPFSCLMNNQNNLITKNSVLYVGKHNDAFQNDVLTPLCIFNYYLKAWNWDTFYFWISHMLLKFIQNGGSWNRKCRYLIISQLIKGLWTMK